MDPERDRGDLVVMVKLPVELRRCPNADGLILGSVNFVFRTFHDDRVFLLDRDIAVGFAVLGWACFCNWVWCGVGFIC